MVQCTFILRLFAFALIVSVSALSQSRIVAPVERNGFTRITPYDTLQAYLSQLAAVSGVRVETIARTKQGRNVTAVSVTSSSKSGKDSRKLRVMLFAQQHGDEPSGKEAMTLLLAKFASGEHSDWLKAFDIIIVPQMNPDGAELRQRRTSDSVDMNRNHLVLTLAETQGLHDLFYRWMPHVSMDIHEYMSGKDWADSGLVKLGDVVLGTLTHPNAPGRIRTYQHETVYPAMATEVRGKGFYFHEYLVGAPDSRIRRSTTELNDGRQSIGILGTLSFIQEGRKWFTVDDTLYRRAHAQLASAEALLGFCARNAEEIRTMVEAARKERTALRDVPVSLRNERTVGSEQMQIPVLDIRTKTEKMWNVTPFQSVVSTYLSAPLPAGYIIPRRLTSVIEVLKRHHIAIETVKKRRTVKAEVFLVDSIATEIWEEDPKAAAVGTWEKKNVLLEPGDMIVKTNQIQAVTIAVALEPQSVWGLIGYAGFDSMLGAKGQYPIARIVE
jgi:hypothetical protein